MPEVLTEKIKMSFYFKMNLKNYIRQERKNIYQNFKSSEKKMTEFRKDSEIKGENHFRNEDLSSRSTRKNKYKR